MANGTLTQVGEQKALGEFTSQAEYTLPTLYIALVTGTSNATTSGTEVTTGQYTGYARQALTGANWGGASSGVSAYNALVNFGTNTAGTGATITGVEIYDAVTSGNRIWWAPPSGGNITLPASSGQVQFASGAITATIPILSAGAGFATTYANRLCDHMTGKTDFAAPAAWWVALTTAASTATTIGTEATYTNYVREQIATPSSFWGAASAASPSLVASTANLTFPAVGATAGSAVISYAIADASSAGNLIYADTITASYTPVTGQSPQFNSGATFFKLT
jgi:hypothetical protein